MRQQRYDIVIIGGGSAGRERRWRRLPILGTSMIIVGYAPRYAARPSSLRERDDRSC